MGILKKQLSTIHGYQQFEGWLLRARSGDKCEYFMGITLVNAITGIRNAVGDAAYAAYEAGKVVLCQRKLFLPDCGWLYAYQAVKI